MPRRKSLKYSKKLAEYVLTHMEKGKDLVAICKEYNKKLKEGEPTLKENSIHSWKRHHPGFKELYDIAYESRLHYLCEYILWLSAQPPENTGDYKRDAALLNQRKLHIDTVKFTLAKLNAIHFKQEINVSHKNAPTIVLTDYSTSAIVETEDEKEEEEKRH